MGGKKQSAERILRVHNVIDGYPLFLRIGS